MTDDGSCCGGCGVASDKSILISVHLQRIKYETRALASLLLGAMAVNDWRGLPNSA